MRRLLKFLFAIAVLALVPRSALAHGVGLNCKLHGDRVIVEAFYDDDSPAVRAQVRVLAADMEVANGLTDDKGIWSFARPSPGKYTIKLDAGAGHRAKDTITVPSDGESPTTAPQVIGDAPRRDEFTRFPVLGLLYGLLIIAGLAALFVLAAAFLKASGGRKPPVDAHAYADVAGFCKSATLDDVRQHGHILTPGRYVGAAEVEDDGEPFDEKMARLTAELREQTKQSARLDKLIWANLEDIGYGG